MIDELVIEYGIISSINRSRGIVRANRLEERPHPAPPRALSINVTKPALGFGSREPGPAPTINTFFIAPSMQLDNFYTGFLNPLSNVRFVNRSVGTVISNDI